MATRYTQQATKQLNPFFQQQTGAIKSQIPAVNQLYDALVQGLSGEREAGMQNVLEDASSRGILRSTLPVAGQAQVNTQMLTKEGQLQAERLQEIGGLQQQLGQVGVQRATSIADLAGNMQKSNIASQRFSLDKQNIMQQIQQAQQQHNLKMQKLQQQLAGF